MRKLDILAGFSLAVTTLALLWIVPEFPLTHLDNPSHWGVVGYAATLVVLLAYRLRGIRGSRHEFSLLTAFLAGMPVIYIAAWLRYGGTTDWLAIELVGLVLYWILAILGVTRSPWFLVLGIAAHGLWDLGHYHRSEYVPDWYAVGCAAIDLAMGLYAAAQVQSWIQRRRPDSA
jgi:hypothetical protein